MKNRFKSVIARIPTEIFMLGRRHPMQLLLAIFSVGLIAFTSLQYVKDLSPQEAVVKIYERLFTRHEDVFGVADQFPKQNVGLYRQMNSRTDRQEPITRKDVARVFGIHADGPARRVVVNRYVNSGETSGLRFREGRFVSYDSVEIPFYELFPMNFDDSKLYPTVVLFTGHGNMGQVAFDSKSYQGGLGVILAGQGFLVIVMENRGMGKLAHLGDHLRIDAVARMVGGSWYGEIATDALWCVEMAIGRSYSGSLGVGGVSTGGALSLLTAALDERISACFVQGYLGSYRTTFGSRGNHHECNNISNIVNEFDMDDIAALIFPRSAVYVNGDRDGFYSEDAAIAFKNIKARYVSGGFPDQVGFLSPQGVGHELSTSLALSYFKSVLIEAGSE